MWTQGLGHALPMHSTRHLHVLTKCTRRTYSYASLRYNSTLSNTSSSPPSSHPNNSTSQSQNENPSNPIPTKPTWSVHALLASYPRPHITHAELTKLHTLSALVPPKEGSEEAERTRRELEELVRLVEAVKLVDTSKVVDSPESSRGREMDEAIQSPTRIPDGRIWEEGRGMELSTNTREVEFEDPEIESGKELLKHAKLTKDGFYVVEADRRRK